MSEKQLLLHQDSETFNNSTLIDNIHQSIIDLELNPPKENVERLLKEAISYSNNDLNETMMNELISLIYSCLSHLPDQKDKFCNDIYKNARKNSNKLIIFASLLSYFPNFSSIDNIKTFISGISKQILKHIKNPTEKFVIFGLEIDKIYETNFISDIILKIKLTEKVISVFYPYIFSLKNLSKDRIKKLIEKVHKMNMGEFLTDEILTNTIIFDSVDQETMSFLIPKMNEQIFTQILNKIENKFLNEKKLNKTLVTSILDKFVEFNIDINSFRIKNHIFDCFDESMMKMNYWDYFAEHEITLSDQVSSKIKEFPIKSSVLKVINNICYVPFNVIVQGFLESDNLELFDQYQKAGLNSIEIQNNLCNTKDFWIHIFSVISNCEEKSCSPSFFASIFQKNIDCEKVYDFFDAMIFHKFPTTHNGNIFLANLLNELSQEYKNNFIKNLNLLLDKVIDSKTLPLPSFWLLFDFEFINNLFENGNKNPLILYAYQFLNSCSKRKEITKLTIPSIFDDKRKNLIINFIKSHDFNILVNLDDDLISFFISAAIFANQKNEPFIEEIATEMILPFFTVSLIYMKKNNGNIFLKSPGLKGLFICAFRLCPKSDDLLIIESTNSIVNFSNYIFDSSSFSPEIAFEIFNTLSIQLINDTYKPDKVNLIKNFFALKDKYSTNSKVKCLYDKNGINLFNYIIRNISKITNFDQLENSLVNLKLFNKEKITFLLNETINKSSIYEDIVNTIYFLEKCCVKIPKLSLNNYKNLLNVVNKALAKNDLRKFMHLNNFIVKNNFDTFKQLSFRNFNITITNIENLIEYSMNIQQIEKDDLISNIFFNILMKDMSIAVNYVTALFENITENNVVIPSDIFENYQDKYKKYPDVFRKAIQHSFKLCSSSSKVFSRIRNWILNEEPYLVTMLLSKINQKQEDYKLYFILKNIASSFPFLFDKNPTQIFRNLLPAFDSFSLIFTNQNDLQSIKIALAAQSFLISILHSVKVLESFIPWILNMIDSLSPSQVLSFTFILESLFHTKKVKDVLMILLIKNCFPFIVVKLFKIEVQEQIRQIYKEKVFNLLFRFFTKLNKLNTFKIILYDEIINHQNNSEPAKRMFSPNLTILPSRIKPLNLLHYIKNDEIIEFINNINRPRSFWLDYKNYFNVSKDETNTFMNDFAAFPKLDEVDFQIGNNIVFIRIFAEYPNWVYQYAVENKKFPLVFDTQSLLKNAVSRMNDMFNYFYFYRYYNTEINYIFRDIFSDNNFYNLCLNEIELNDDNDILIKLMNIIFTNETAIDYIQNSMNSFISENIKLNKIDTIHKIINTISETEIKFNNKFNNCEDNLIDYALLPENRQNYSFISSLLKFLCLTENVPIKATHLIGLSLVNDDQKDLLQIYNLCKKIGENNLCNIKKLIKNKSEMLLKNKETSYELIISIFEAFPSFINSHMDLAPLLLDKLFMKFKEGDKSVIDMITIIFNSISPEPNNDLNEIDISFDNSLYNGSSRPTSAKIFAESNPEFWDIYKKYRDQIIEVVRQSIENLKKFKIFEYYPELINFDLRLSFLRQNLKEKLSTNETELAVRRSNVLVDSFNQLNDKPFTEWMNKFKIRFEDEKGYDEGGLTKEWFTLVIEDLFNPNFALFVQSNNKGYQPNPYSSINNEHIEYFKFAGKLIARAIIQGQCVSAHFTQSFRRQILRTQVKLKDYEDIDKEIYNSMKMILENDADSLGLNFTIDDDEFGNVKTIPLKENGEEIEVTNENKFEYVKLYINYRLRKSILNQVEAFCQGFNWLIPHDNIKMFSQDELDLIICGIPNIDVEDLRANTVYEKPYNKKHPVIRMFFKVISKWNSDNLAKFLLFLTGSSQVPVNGFKDYKERDNPIRIAPGGDKDRLCVAHTCFNTLDLPAYENEKDLERKLLLAIQECREFALA